MSAVANWTLPDGMQGPSAVCDIVRRRAEFSPTREALIDHDGVWTYAELGAAVSAMREWLGGSGVRLGDRVMIVGENCRALVALMFATLELNAWPVLASARLADREIDQIRDHCGARRVIVTVTASPRARSLADQLGTAIEQPLSGAAIAITQLNEAAEAEPVGAEAAEQVAALIYTSGTTGQPKGVMLTNRNLLFIARTTGMLRELGARDRIYAVIPVTHILGLAVVLLGPLLYGSTIYLAPRFDPAAVLKVLEHERISWMMGGPALFALLVEFAKHKRIPAVRAPGLRIISAAGAPLDPAVKAATESLFGMTLHNGYGVTECSPTITQTRLGQARTDCSVGPALPGIEVKLVGQAGRQVGENEIGEIWVRGPSVMKGYYKGKDATQAVINTEGWFNTRDLARLKDGHLFIVGRTKELIIRYGFNISPPEIEAVLNAHPAVTQSAVIGRPAKQQQAKGEEEIVAFVQLASGAAVTVDDLAAYAAEQLAIYKRPSEIIVVPALPVGTSGKILKSELRRFACAEKYTPSHPGITTIAAS